MEIKQYQLTGEKQPFPYVGIGAQFNQGLYSQLSSAAYGFQASHYKDIEDKVIRMGCQHIRIFYDDTPTTTAQEEYGKDTADRDSFHRVVALAQKIPNATVNITYWHGPYTFSEKSVEGTDDLKTPYECPHMERFANELYDLIVNKNYSCIQYVTLQNEVDTTKTITREIYEKIYRSFVYYMKKLGIRDRIKLVGGDFAHWLDDVRFTWLDYLGREMNDILDGYSHHQYWEFFDERGFGPQTRLDKLKTLLNYTENVMPAEQRKPIYITEYGVRGYREEAPESPYYNATSYPKPGVGKPHDPQATQVIELPVCSSQIAYYQILALHHGVVGFCQWDAYRAKYDHAEEQDFSAIGRADEGFKLRPAYYQHQLLGAATVPGSDILKVQSPDGQESKVAALKAPNGSLTLLLAHKEKQTENIKINGLPSNQKFYVYDWNDTGNGKNSPRGTLKTNPSGCLDVEVKSQEMTILTQKELDKAIF